MALVFKTQEDSTDDVEIVGVGVVGGAAVGGVTVADAAARLPELQKVDARGEPVLDEDGAVQPLTGSALTAAAKRFAETHNLEVVNLKEAKVAGLPQERGMVPDRPDAVAVAEAEYEFTYGGGTRVPPTVPVTGPNATASPTINADEETK